MEDHPAPTVVKWDLALDLEDPAPMEENLDLEDHPVPTAAKWDQDPAPEAPDQDSEDNLANLHPMIKWDPSLGEKDHSVLLTLDLEAQVNPVNPVLEDS